MKVICSCVPHSIARKKDILTKEQGVDRAGYGGDVYGKVGLGIDTCREEATGPKEEGNNNNTPREKETILGKGSKSARLLLCRLRNTGHGTSFFSSDDVQIRRGPNNLSFFGSSATLSRQPGT
jgi:hypothetical protein